MATLTWQDVAGGNLRAPDMSEATDAITQGITGLGKSVQDILMGPEQRRQADAVRELTALQGKTNAQGKIAEGYGNLSGMVKADRKEKDIKEFGAVQSTLEAKARDIAANGGSFDDFLQSEAYLKTGEGARAYGASQLSDAFFQGTSLLEQRKDDARQQSQWAAGHAAQQRQYAISNARASRHDAQSSTEHDLRVKALKRAARDADGGFGYKDAQTRALLDRKNGSFTRKVGEHMFNATGGAYDDKSLAELAKSSGFTDISEATESLNTLNANRMKLGKPLVPEGVLKALIAGQSGKNGWWAEWGNSFDQGDFEKDLAIRADLFDNAMGEHNLLQTLMQDARRGVPVSGADIQAAMAELKPRQATPQPRAPLPSLGTVFSAGRK